MSSLKKTYSSYLFSFLKWFDSYGNKDTTSNNLKSIDWLRTIPFIALHFSVLFVFVVGWSPVAVITGLVFYILRMLAITGFYHRYFSHKAFKTTRIVQFIFAVIGASAVQRGPLWWASHHRLHHKNADNEDDQHSPLQQGFIWSHTGWFLSKNNFATRYERISDFSKFPELKFIDRFDVLVPIIFGLALYFFGEMLALHYPSSGTTGVQMFIWGFVISTLMLYHITFTINSIAHKIGRRRFNTKDDSKNNWLLAILTFGEGWHNNHHFYPGSARQGFVWWEIDICYYFLKGLEKIGLIWDLKPIPKRVKDLL